MYMVHTFLEAPEPGLAGAGSDCGKELKGINGKYNIQMIEKHKQFTFTSTQGSCALFH